MDAQATTKPRKGLLSKAFQLLLPLVITVALVWYMFTKIDFGTLWETLQHGVRYPWLLATCAVSVLSHIVRALRWRLQLRTLHVDPPLHALSCSIFGTYALNLVLPRLGELWRCTYISRRQRAPLTTILGTMVSDRLCDTLTVLCLLLLTLGLAHDQVTGFIDRYHLGSPAMSLLSSPKMWVYAVLALAVLGAVAYAARRTRPMQAVKKACVRLWSGFASVARVKSPALFMTYTLGIWGCYFFQLYLAFYAFDCTRMLLQEPGTAAGLLPCLVAFVLSSIGMAVPSNGGLGPWNICIIFALSLWGVAESPAAAMSIVVWSAQTLTLIMLGIYTAIYISKDTTPSPSTI